MKSKMLFLHRTVVTASIIMFFYINPSQSVAAPAPKKPAGINPPAAWSFKREITIENNGGKVSDAVIQIELSSEQFDYTKAKADGADIRFSTTSGKPTSAGLSYWIEQWNNNGISRVWVKVPLLKAHSKNLIHMFYGNTEARPVSNGNTTFLFFDDFEDGDYTKKWNNVSIGEVVEKDGLLKLKESDGQDGIITANFTVTGQMIIRTLYQRGGADEHWTRGGVGGWNYWLCFGDHTDVAATGTNYVMLFDSASITSLKSAPLIKVANKVITAEWRKVAYWYNGNSLKGMQDDVVAEWPAAPASSKLALRTLDNDNWDNFAFITVSAYLNSQPVVTIGKQLVQ